MDDRAELSGFLKSRRARLRPGDVGLREHGGTRRVGGLRREELAAVAGVSIAHYTRLEQGRGEAVSPGILDAVGRALRLDADELAYLHGLAHRGKPCPHETTLPEAWRTLLDSFVRSPALVFGRHTQILAANRLAVAVFGQHRTLTHTLFASRGLYRDWEAAARGHVAHLRVLHGRYGDADLAAHIAEMRGDTDFARLWDERPVARLRERALVLDHPLAGELRLVASSVALPEAPACCGLEVFAAEAGSASEEALRRL
ncbi:helix-turn-helix domain-containing protein [Actinorhabdospora filicis]|uniref:helix-turn-helix domain-containing protein n=1 Tax=Actinorhabdospora filicis TaxID=1785913 RepID=UPI0025539D1E|nr:helix-turn-helix transcriptional regulator [Actinorhabdospora filicis]